jgi:hypothetical protein
VRKQYYFRQTPEGLYAWDVDRLVALTAPLPRRTVALSEIRELDEPWSQDDAGTTWLGLVEHVRLMHDADLAYPIILAADGRVMDGMHRVAKALTLGHTEITAVRFTIDPPPDYVGKGPDELPY